MAELEGGHAALAVPSGLTATTLPFLAFLKPGDHALVTDVVYGPTRRFCESHVRRLGVDVEYYDPLIGAGIADKDQAEHATRIPGVAGVDHVSRSRTCARSATSRVHAAR
jgi:cystathionine beta-lyase/cystathionine gamma-synthase